MQEKHEEIPLGIFLFEPILYSIRSTIGRTIFFSSNFGGNAVGCVTGNARDVWQPIFRRCKIVMLIRRKWAVLRFLRILSAMKSDESTIIFTVPLFRNDYLWLWLRNQLSNNHTFELHYTNDFLQHTNMLRIITHVVLSNLYPL